MPTKNIFGATKSFTFKNVALNSVVAPNFVWAGKNATQNTHVSTNIYFFIHTPYVSQ